MSTGSFFIGQKGQEDPESHREDRFLCELQGVCSSLFECPEAQIFPHWSHVNFTSTWSTKDAAERVLKAHLRFKYRHGPQKTLECIVKTLLDTGHTEGSDGVRYSIQPYEPSFSRSA